MHKQKKEKKRKKRGGGGGGAGKREENPNIWTRANRNTHNLNLTGKKKGENMKQHTEVYMSTWTMLFNIMHKAGQATSFAEQFQLMTAIWSKTALSKQAKQ